MKSDCGNSEGKMKEHEERSHRGDEDEAFPTEEEEEKDGNREVKKWRF
jgi:hypothetical protein